MSFNRFDFIEIGQPPDPEDQARLQQSQQASPESDAAAGETSDRSGDASEMRAIRTATNRRNRQPYTPPDTEALEYSDSARGLSTYHPPGRATVGADEIEIRVVEVFGTRGLGVGEFNFPAGVAVDAFGILFVADVHNHRVQRITPDGGVSIIGSRGAGKMQFVGPTGVACDQDRSFYVLEQGNCRVQKFTSEGTLDLVLGRPGVKTGEFRTPTGICVSPTTKEILIADTGNARVQRFTQAGHYIGSLGGAGSVQPPLSNPQSVACDHLGNIYVADTLSNRIARYDPLGRFTGHFGGVLRGPLTSIAPNVRFTEPCSLACNQRGEIFVADGNNGPGRVVVLTPDTGQIKATIDDPGRGVGPISRPGGLAIAPRMRSGYPDNVPRADLYVADTMNHRIIRFTCT